MENKELSIRIEKSLSLCLNEIVFSQTDEDVLYFINFKKAIAVLKIPLLSLALNATSEFVVNPAIESFIEAVKSVEVEEKIVISAEQARSMMINTLYPSPSENDMPNIEKLVAIFEEKYKKRNNTPKR